MEACSGAEFFLDTEKLVVLRDAVGAAGGARLIWPARGDGKVSDEGTSVSPERWEMMEL